MKAASGTGSGIVYTCDVTINAVSATACDTLNTTIAALYSNAFTNANACIYIQMGDTAGGLSSWGYTEYSYNDYRNALIAVAAGANDTTAINNLPETNPFGSNTVGITFALQRALGLLTGSCSDNPGSYDGTITISNSIPLYFRTGSISNNQYDFFMIAEHETDEVLGTASCAFCGSSIVYPADYFRYHSDGTRSFAAGTNDPCSSSDSTNACFSIDGVHMLQQYNNMSNGNDAGDWVTNCASPLVQDAMICGGISGIDISPTAEILALDVFGYTLVGSSVPGTVTSVASPTPNGTYWVGASIAIQIAFSEAVTVTGTPQLALNSGGTASYSSGSGTSTLTFIYIVEPGQNTTSLDYTSTGSLTLNGGSIQGPGNATVSLTLPAPGAPGSLGAGTDIVINTIATMNNRSFVSTTGSDANNCSASAYCRSFAAALALTNPEGEIVVVNSGGYGPVTITQPVVITAIDIDASITATSGNALTINTTGNVTITGLNLNGDGTGNDGVLVQSVGFLRLYNMQIQNFANNGIEFTASGNLALYDSKVNDSGHDGLLLQNASAQAYAHNSDFDHNAFAGADSVLGNIIIADSSADYNQYGFYADGATVALNNDRATFNTNAMAASSTGKLYFADCLISDNTHAWSILAGGTIADSNPGTSLITPGQSPIGTLASAIALQ